MSKRRFIFLLLFFLILIFTACEEGGAETTLPSETDAPTAEILPMLVDAISRALPKLLSAGLKIVKTLADAIIKNLPTLLTAAGKIILATVKGDVHDIGKNICATLLRCNGYEVIDLGVMVEASVILDATLRHNPEFVGLSGLITPSLSEMKHVVQVFQQNGCKVPVLIGGATTSAEHTARHLAPYYDAPVLWSSDASQLVILAKKLYVIDGEKRTYSSAVAQLQKEQEGLRNTEIASEALHALTDSRQRAMSLY